jgi:hypothetical protein
MKMGAVKKNKIKLHFDSNGKTDTIKIEVLILFQTSEVEITEELQQLIGTTLEVEDKTLNSEVKNRPGTPVHQSVSVRELNGDIM